MFKSSNGDVLPKTFNSINSWSWSKLLSSDDFKFIILLLKVVYSTFCLSYLVLLEFLKLYNNYCDCK